MKTLNNTVITKILSISSQFTGIFILAMALGGQRVRHEFFEMTSDLIQVSSRLEFAEWTIRSQYRMIELVKIDWKPVSVFPKEAKRLQ